MFNGQSMGSMADSSVCGLSASSSCACHWVQRAAGDPLSRLYTVHTTFSTTMFWLYRVSSVSASGIWVLFLFTVFDMLISSTSLWDESYMKHRFVWAAFKERVTLIQVIIHTSSVVFLSLLQDGCPLLHHYQPVFQHRVCSWALHHWEAAVHVRSLSGRCDQLDMHVNQGVEL